ncbi:MAG: glutamine synthetase [Nitriliruptorales bacterium]|nr:glutamine synthetase [Nitriliruptorales bacterium]
MLTRDELASRVGEGTIDTVIVAFTDHYGRQMGKRFDAGFFLDEAVELGTHGCDYLLTVDMEMEPVPGYAYANWELGYGDFHLVPDLGTLRVASWLDRTALVLCDVEDQRAHGPVTVAPRSILARQIRRATDLGFTAKAGSELEYFLYSDSYAQANAKGYADLKPHGWYIEDYHLLQGTREEHINGALRRHLRDSGIPVETSKGEWGRGQHELNVRYTDVMTMADRHVIYKQCAKDIAEQLGLAITFMAKPDESEAGSSCHVHISLWDGDDNAFVGDDDFGPVTASKTFGSFLAGMMAHVADVMVLYAPTINSYKRYQSGSWAPTQLAWSRDNRTAGFRVVGSGPALRIECRIPGADCNPYLTFAGLLASGLDGVERELEAPAAFEGDVYGASDLAHVPQTLRHATARFAESAFVKESFGEDVQEHYAHFFRVEQDAFDKAVTDWERRRYFERI